MGVVAVEKGVRRQTRAGSGSALACAVAAGAVANILLGCRDCSGAVRPIPPALLGAQFALCALTALAYATHHDSTRRRTFAIGLNALAFAGLLVATAHGVVAHEGFCPSCLLTWAGLGIALLFQGGESPIVRWWLPAVLAGSLALRATTRGTGESALLLQSAIKSDLTAVGFDYHIPRTTLRPGNVVPGLEAVKGLTVFLTKCSPCTRKMLEAGLAKNGVRPNALTFVVADGSAEWQVPAGFTATPRIVDARAWSRAGIAPFGPPCLVRMTEGKVTEVIF